MFILPFAKYLKPHRLRIAFGIFCLFGVGFFGTYSMILGKPALDVLFAQKKAAELKIEFDAKMTKKEKETARHLESSSRVKRFIGHVREFYSPYEKQARGYVLKFYEYAEGGKPNKIKCLWGLAGLIVLSSLLSGLFDYGSQYNLSLALYSAVMTLKNAMFRNIMRQDMAFFGLHPVGYLMSRLNSDVTAIRRILEYVIKDALRQVITLSFIISVLFILDWKMTLWAFVGLAPAIVLLVVFAKTLRKVTRTQKTKSDLQAATANQSLENIRLIKSLTSEGLECEKFVKQNLKIFKLEMKRRIARFASSPLMVFLGSIGLSAILLMGGLLVLDSKQNDGAPDPQVQGAPIRSREPMDASTFIIYIVALGQLYLPLKRLGGANVTWQLAKVSAERIGEVLRYQPVIMDPPEDLPPVRLARINKGIGLRGVHFAYSDKVILRDMSLEIQKGATTAIVGRSGAGKSTLANLLLRFFDPARGSVEMDGVDIRQMRVADLRALFGIVSQETLLFNDTVAGNIAYGVKEVSRERIEQAARAANAHDFILALDGGKGYDTMIGPHGGNLSGGQRQRIAIARAFCRDPQILILDEATSALDNESESAVQQALQHLMANRTVVVIAHRLSTIMHADTIVVLDEGRIVEQGRHAELLGRGGHYANLYKLGEFAEG
jgi:ABC-type multidrug transport system fused ATPase/permease subunit